MNECRQWLNSNKNILAKYDVDEMAQMAVLCGFSIEDVSKTLPEWHMDLMTRTTIHQRQAYFVDREIKTVEHFLCDKPNLEEQWFRLFQYENGRDSDA